MLGLSSDSPSAIFILPSLTNLDSFLPKIPILSFPFISNVPLFVRVAVYTDIKKKFFTFNNILSTN